MTEDNRPVPGFHGVVYRDHETFLVSYALQDVYDVAINSMDFGSGFLSTEEVEHLRELGRAIGAPPLHYQCKASPWSKDNKCTCGAEADR